MKTQIGALAIALAFSASADANPINCDPNHGFTRAQAQKTLCNFNWTSLRFAGTAVEQARCLMRHVGPHQQIGAEELTQGLEALIGKPQDFRLSALQKYLDNLGLKESDVGGALLSSATAPYFVIHDTSAPNCSTDSNYCPVLGKFPANMNDADWTANSSFIGHPKEAPNRIGHVIVNRAGGSIKEVDFALPLRAIKLQSCSPRANIDGIFLSIENIQPRLSTAPAGTKANGKHAPEPGFSDAQYERLGLLYVVASARHGVWMIPAYHAVIDSYYEDGHDDPRNFDIVKFTDAVAGHVRKVKESTPN